MIGPPKEICLLVDYRGAFYSSMRNMANLCSMDVSALRRYFADLGCNLLVRPLADVDLRTDDYKGRWVLYQSAEDRGLHYKGYIEDVLLGLQLQGARLIPPFAMFRAHHNKAFLEILRDVTSCADVKSIRSRAYGTLEDFLRAKTDYPSVIKASATAGSRGVRLLRNHRDKVRYGRKFSRVPSLRETIREVVRTITQRPYVRRSLHRRKFVVQTYVPGLEGDYKVLVFGQKYYVLHRRNRKNDFRASGSGLFDRPETLPPGLLDFARRVFGAFAVPYISLDVAFDGQAYHMIEAQFVSFGPLTLEYSEFHYARQGEDWVKVVGKSVLEEEVARSVVAYVGASSG